MSLPYIIHNRYAPTLFLALTIRRPGGHCKQLAPEYEKAATNLKGIVKVGAVDCDVEKELCGSFEVKGA